MWAIDGTLLRYGTIGLPSSLFMAGPASTQCRKNRNKSIDYQCLHRSGKVLFNANSDFSDRKMNHSFYRPHPVFRFFRNCIPNPQNTSCKSNKSPSIQGQKI
jgi:hypothetical protein